ncbi:MAG TPA: hypothetical protein PKD20_00015 [Candidatus Saccharibacteria bacterium]|jgi:uncharacterized protein YoxC|nr:hypothetical protein [Candidatus Saccharibacteria bacterium]HMT55240.1 hypothetical protein [Candidatus Saccharibacteria bacterium]
MDSFDILVILLSVTLGLSLIIWIAVGILCIQVLKKIKLASDSAREAVEHVEAFTSQLKNIGRATAFGSVINQVTKMFKGRK